MKCFESDADYVKSNPAMNQPVSEIRAQGRYQRLQFDLDGTKERNQLRSDVEGGDV